MNEKRTKSVGALRWRRFSGKGYAVLQSLHREVTIGVLSVAMLATADLKAQTTKSEGTAHIADIEAEEVQELEDVEVTATRVPLTESTTPRIVSVISAREASASKSVNDLLECASGVDVRQRGEMGVQTDISVRGGTFDQTTILLNGININNPQIGHYSADFPLGTEDIERIEITEGASARTFGTSAFSGAVNIVPKRDTKSGVSAHAYGGAYGLAGGEARASLKTRKVVQSLSGGYRRADGDQPNSDFKMIRFFYQGDYQGDALDLQWQTGVSSFEYGANTFYSAAYPDQWDNPMRWITSVRAETKGKVHFTPAIYWVRTKDHYQLVRNTDKGENFHRTDTYGANLGAWVESKAGKTAVGAELRSEGILSTNLGRPTEDSVKVRGADSKYYTRADDRTNISFYAEHNFILRKWTISLGAMAYRSTYRNASMKVYPGLDLCFRPTDKWKITASWSMATRLPTFTDLYYKSPTHAGNVGLKPEETMSIDLGTRFRQSGVEAKLCGFYTRGKNMLDWVMYNADDVFHSASFELDNAGLELYCAFLGREILGEKFPIRILSLGYAYIHQERHDDTPVFKSNYALEYLRHKVVATLETRVVSHLSATITLRYQDRNGAYIKYDEAHKSTGELVDYKPYTLVDLRLSWDKPHWSVYAEASNLFDVEYYDHGNIPQAGVWVRGGAKVRF